MPNLNEFGVLPPRSASEPRYQERMTISHQEFCKRAGELLLKIKDTVVSDSVPELERYPSAWQPMGFQIYDLGIYPELGFLRLHVWPEQVRRATQKTDIIHSHPRHIASTVLFGVYRDSIFDIRRGTDQGSKVGSSYTMYGKTIYADQTEALLSKDVAVDASVKENRTVTTGGQHFIEPGVFHQTRIPLGETCVTLAFNSFRTGADGPYVLLHEPPNFEAELRESITLQEVNDVKKLFTDA